MKKLRMGILGLGQRGSDLLKNILECIDNATVVAVCDLYEDRANWGKDLVKGKTGNAVFATTNPTEVIEHPDVDAVMIFTSWETHIPLAIQSMKAGKAVAMEVGGAYTVDQCWELVKVQEETGMPFMFLENCCYDRREMMALNMAQSGVLGTIVHCSGGYCHDLRDEISEGEERRHYRLRNYLNRNAENYPTHELGPIAKVLNINRGNRFVSLVSVASKAAGLHEYCLEHRAEDDPLRDAVFKQGDIVTTTITCAGGETVTLTLDTTLPRYYDRQFCVRGTKGMYEGTTDSVYMDGDGHHFDWRQFWGNAKDYEEKYDHPLWKAAIEAGKAGGGHGGIDMLVMRDFVDSVLAGKPCPIDVYDAVAWMVVTPLSEQSIALGGAPVTFPDFTNGKWTQRKPE